MYILRDVFILQTDSMFSLLQRRKLEKIINARLRKDIGLTFKPEINQKSIELCKQVRKLHADSFYLHENLKLESPLSSSFSQTQSLLFKQKGLEAINVSDRLSSIQRSVHLDCKLESQVHWFKFVMELEQRILCSH